MNLYFQQGGDFSYYFNCLAIIYILYFVQNIKKYMNLVYTK